MALPEDEWAHYNFHPGNTIHGESLYERRRREFHHEIMKAKLRLGELDEVLQEVQQRETALPALDAAVDDWPQLYMLLHRRAELRAVRLTAVRYLMDQDRLGEAQAMLERIGAQRPDPLRLPDGRMDLPIGASHYTSFDPRSTLRQLWREFDTVRWDLADRRAANETRIEPTQ